MRFSSLILLFISLSILFLNETNAEAPKQTAPQKNYISVTGLPDLQTAYTIEIPGNQTGPNTFEPTKIYKIPLLDKKYYISNTFYIKTKNIHFLDKNAKGFNSSILQNSIKDLGIVKIRHPFKEFAEGNMLSADKYGVGRIYEVSYSSPVDPYDVCRDLMTNPEVEYAVPLFINYPTDFTPNDPKIGSQWMINKIQLPKAWDISKGSKDIVIGIVDTGTDTDHEDLAGTIWTNPNEIPGNGKDDDNNGKIDDVSGWDFVGNVSQNEAWNGIFREDNVPRPSQTNNFHGTHVAGCAGAITNNSTGVASPVFEGSIIPIKCSSDNGGVRGIYRGYEGILYAATLGADVINCSWIGPGSSPADQDMINAAVELGSVVCVAAGNDGLNLDENAYYPSNYDNVLCVGATRSNDKAAGFSSYGSGVTVFAPGQGIYSTMPGNSYNNESGTSMATPITSGVVALLRNFKPNWGPDKITAQIRSTSDNTVAQSPGDRRRFYGRINAYKALDYNGHNPANNVPGIRLTKFEIEGDNAIRSFERTYISLEFTNYLASVADLNVTISAFADYLDISKPSHDLGVLGSDQSKTISLSVQLNEKDPWYYGEIKLLLTYTSNTYTDYEIVKVPIIISSENKFFTASVFPDDFAPVWNDCSSSAAGNCWAVGSSQSLNRGIVYRTGVGGAVLNYTPDVFYAVESIDDNRAIAGSGPTNENAKIYSTTDAGQNWTSKSVSNITGFINDIHFFDGSEGIFLGDQKNGLWGVGRSTNGGSDWSAVTGIPAPQSGENGFAGCAYWYGDYGWFGTNKGRVYRTTDKGKTWRVSIVEQSGFIHRIGFQDEKNGVVVYSLSDDPSEPKYVANTGNGGSTWNKNSFNFTENDLDPVDFFTFPRSDKIYALCTNNEIIESTNNGKSWEFLLTYQSLGANAGSGISRSGFDARIWEAGLAIGHFDFSYVPPDAVKEIQLVSGDLLEYDSTEIGSSNREYIEIKNTGEVPVKFNDFQFLPVSQDLGENEFELFGQPPTQINAGVTIKLRIQFKPEKVGLRHAWLKIKSDGGDRNVELKGYGKNPASVSENTKSGGYILRQNIPNPVTGESTFPYFLPKPGTIIFRIFDQAGAELKYINIQSEAGENELKLNMEDMSSGVYLLQMTAGNISLTRSFIVKK